MSDPITTEERYARAASSSHLEVTPHMDAISVIIAAGWVRDSLGTMLYRLKVDFDAAKACRRTPQGLPHALEAVERFAIRQGRRHAARMAYRQDDAGDIGARALMYWLDPLCGHCHGRGFCGGSGEPVELCKHCHGSGRTLPKLGKTEDGQHFGYLLVSEFERKTARVGELIKRHLRNA